MSSISANKSYFAPLEKIDHYTELIDRGAVAADSQTLTMGQSQAREAVKLFISLINLTYEF